MIDKNSVIKKANAKLVKKAMLARLEQGRQLAAIVKYAQDTGTSGKLMSMLGKGKEIACKVGKKAIGVGKDVAGMAAANPKVTAGAVAGGAALGGGTALAQKALPGNPKDPNTAKRQRIRTALMTLLGMIGGGAIAGAGAKAPAAVQA